MDPNDLTLVSVDDHVIEPPSMFEGRLPARFRERAPRVETSDDGRQAWLFGDEVVPNIGISAVAGYPPDEIGLDPSSFADMRPGAYDIHERVRDMNVNGQLGAMCFPSFPQFAGQLFSRAKDKDLALAVIRAYNEWHVEEWCGTYPGRFMPLGLVPLWDPHLAAEETRRLADMDCHAVAFTASPSNHGYSTFHTGHWDPLWTACQDVGTVPCIHLGSGGSVPNTTGDAPILVSFTLIGMHLSHPAADLLWSPILRKFPELKFALSEGGAGWVPYFLERIDWVYDRHRGWVGQDFGDRRPSEVAREHFITCFIDDPVGVRLRDMIGVDMMCWESDFPHADASWPDAPENLARSLQGVPADEIAKISHLNAMRHFQYDPFKHIPEAEATAGALRAAATDVQIEFRPGGSKKKFQGPVRWDDLSGALDISSAFGRETATSA